MLRLSSGERPLRRAGLQIARHLRRTIHGSVCLAQSLWVGLLLLTIAVELGLHAGAAGCQRRPPRGEVRAEDQERGELGIAPGIPTSVVSTEIMMLKALCWLIMP